MLYCFTYLLQGTAQLCFIQHPAVYTPNLGSLTALCCITPYILHKFTTINVQLPKFYRKNPALSPDNRHQNPAPPTTLLTPYPLSNHLHLTPTHPRPRLRLQRNAHRVRVRHCRLHHLCSFSDLLLRHLQHQLIMHLQKHFGA